MGAGEGRLLSKLSLGFISKTWQYDLFPCGWIGLAGGRLLIQEKFQLCAGTNDLSVPSAN